MRNCLFFQNHVLLPLPLFSTCSLFRDWICLIFLHRSNCSWKIKIYLQPSCDTSLPNKYLIKIHLFLERRLLFIKNGGCCGNVVSLKYTSVLDNSAAELQGIKSYSLNWSESNKIQTWPRLSCGFLWFVFLNDISYFSQMLLKFLTPALLWCIFCACQPWLFRAWLYQHFS